MYGVPPNESELTCTSGATTFSLEFGILSKLTGDPTYEVIFLKNLGRGHFEDEKRYFK